eukprot:CAMPEP_0117831034 /NCGR_PEP_ID=MMETSP0949-20121206/8858_1 /TAXON_ID=44440 /ORGANISM="Chattonella subsalsa, Strain CCMP2191" /LENGTH=126 /DNA_ID=CAMNT_0005672173 /DNA_START=32 /DNA_END=408 /DNA_ORIENTATION=-
MPRRSESPGYRGGGGGGSGRRNEGCSLLVRNLSYRTRNEDLRYVFGKFGDLRDVYIPRDYYTQEPRGFAFVEYVDPRDASDAREDMDGYQLDGRELAVIFAQDRRKRPEEMRTLTGPGFGGGRGRG